MADFPMPLPDGWEADGAYPANVDSKGGTLTLGQILAQAASDGVVLTLAAFDNQVDAFAIVDIQPKKNATVFNEIFIRRDGALLGSGDPAFGNGQWFIIPFQGGGQGTVEFDSFRALFYANSTASGLYYEPWTADTFFFNFWRTRPTVENGHYYEAIPGNGSSGGTEPTWPTNGGTVVDGDITWQDMGLYPLDPALQVFGAAGMGSGFVPRAEILKVWKDNGGSAPAWSIGSYGEEILWPTSEPADGDVATGSRSQYYDATNGAPKLWIKERDLAGTLFKKIGAVKNSDGSFDMALGGVAQLINNQADPLAETDGANRNYVDNTGIGRIYATTANQYVQANAQLILEEFYEIGSGFETELASGALLSVDRFAQPFVGFRSGVDRSGGYIEILTSA